GLCPKFCVNMSLRKCTSLSAGAAKPPSAPPCGVLPRLCIRQESPYISFVSFFTHYVGRNRLMLGSGSRKDKTKCSIEEYINRNMIACPVYSSILDNILSGKR